MSDSSTSVALTPLPEIDLAGRTYVGRLLSIAEWFAFKDRLTAQAAVEKAEGVHKKPETLEAARQLMLEFLRATFPPVTGRWPWSHSIDPIAPLEQRGLRDVQALFVRFFIHQRHAMGFTVPLSATETTPTTGTSGIDSPPSTTREPSGDASASANAPAS